MDKEDQFVAVFLDRDGVINDMVARPPGFTVHGKVFSHTAPFSYEEFVMRPGVAEALKAIQEVGFLTILVTNQPDINYGMLPVEEHEKIMADVYKLPLDDIFVCMHGRNDSCECKKPKPGMLLEAGKKLNISLENSWIVGDSKADILAGQAVGCQTILVRGPQKYDGPEPDFTVDTLEKALEIISR